MLEDVAKRQRGEREAGKVDREGSMAHRFLTGFICSSHNFSKKIFNSSFLRIMFLRISRLRIGEIKE